MIYRGSSIAIYFGDASDNLMFDDNRYHKYAQWDNIAEAPELSHLKNVLGLNFLVFDRQEHSCIGRIIDRNNSLLKSFSQHGDYLIAHEKRLGIGVLTADCLPIVLYDTQHHVIAAIHAGWRGSVKHIAHRALQAMQEQYETRATDIQVFFGPSIGQCCYAVGGDVVGALEPWAASSLAKRGKTTYFDLKKYNQIILMEQGVQETSFSYDYCPCTMCNKIFWSYRRDRNKAGRQMTIVYLP